MTTPTRASTRLGLLSATLAWLVVASPLRADVLVVDDLLGAGATHPDIASAVFAAQGGDTILVRGGSYNSFTVDGVSLVVTAEPGEVALVTGPIVVRNLAGGQSVVLDGLRQSSTDSAPGLRVEDCFGPVWVQDCSFNEPYVTQVPVHGIEIHDSHFVTIQGTESEGSRAQGTIDGGLGLLAVDSDVALLDSTLRGGTSLTFLGLTLAAGDGLHLDGGWLHASGGSITGGDGSHGSGPFGCSDGGDGGTGIVLTGANPRLRVLGTTIAGGEAGGTEGTCLPGVAGQDMDVLSGSVQSLPYTPRSLSIPGPLRSGEQLVADLAGDPGDLVWAIVSPAQAPTLIPGGTPFVGGALLPDLGAGQVFVVGLLGPSGSLQLSLPVPPIPATFTRFVQAIAFSANPGGETVLSGGATVTFLADGL